MTDMNTALASQAIPEGFRYSEVKPKGMMATSTFNQFSANNGSSFGPNQIVEIPISSASAFLDPSHSYLRFKASITATGAVNCNTDAGGHGVIKRLRVLTSNGQEICRIDEYGALTKMVNDTQRNLYATNTASIFEGMEGGYNMGTQRLLAFAGAGSQDTWFELPLHCVPILGLMSSNKYVPLVIMGGIKLELLLAGASEWLSYDAQANAGTYTISQVSYNGAMITPNNSFLQSFRMVASSVPITLSYQSFHCFNYSVPANANSQQVSLIVNDTLKSVRSLFAFHRLTAQFTTFGDFTYSNRPYYSTNNIYAIVDGQTIPQYRINPDGSDVGQVFVEYRKGWSKLGSVFNGGVVNPINYVAGYNVAGNDTSGRFCFGLDMDVLQSSAVMAGRNISALSGQALNLYFNINNGNAPTTTTVCLLYDGEVQINPDGSVLVVV